MRGTDEKIVIFAIAQIPNNGIATGQKVPVITPRLAQPVIFTNARIGVLFER